MDDPVTIIVRIVNVKKVQYVTLNDRRNTRLSFVKENNYKVDLNLVKNRFHLVTNVVDKKMDRFKFGEP